MNRPKLSSRRTLLLGLAALLLPAGLLFAGARGSLGFAGHRGDGSCGHGAMMHRIADKLGLTDAQRNEIQGILKAHKEELKGEMEKVRASRQDQFSAIHSETFDEGVIRAAAGKAAEAEADLAVTRGKIASEVREVLTPDQRAKAAEVLKDAQAFGNEMFHRFHQRLEEGPFGGDS